MQQGMCMLEAWVECLAQVVGVGSLGPRAPTSCAWPKPPPPPTPFTQLTQRRANHSQGHHQHGSGHAQALPRLQVGHRGH